MPRLLVIVILTAITGTPLSAQNLSDSIINKMEKMFKSTGKPGEPGGVVGVAIGNQATFSTGWGLANMETGAINDKNSICYMCSISKQFAGFAVALLMQKGQLTEEEDVKKIIPELHDFGKKITVGNLLHHTSGIRDDITLAGITGLSSDGMLTDQLALNILFNQTTLNFNPGEKFSYSNSNYVLLAEIVSRVSKQTFRNFVDSAIFKPLHMNASAFVDDFSEIIPNRAESYSRVQDKYHHAVHNVYTMGDGGLFTNMDDMIRWIRNFYDPVAGDTTTLEQFTKTCRLNNNTPNRYAFGISVDTIRGQRCFRHNGSLAGYRTDMIVFPDLKIGIAMFCNKGDRSDFSKFDSLIAMLVPDKSIKVAIQQPVAEIPISGVKPDSSAISKMAGVYIAEDGTRFRFGMTSGAFMLNQHNLLLPATANSFRLKNAPAVKFSFKNIGADNQQVVFVSPALSLPKTLSKVNEFPLKQVELKQFEGQYYSGELKVNLQIRILDTFLLMSKPNSSDVKITMFGPEHMYTDDEALYHFNIIRNSRQQIIAIELSSGDMRNLVFTKTSQKTGSF